MIVLRDKEFGLGFGNKLRTGRDSLNETRGITDAAIKTLNDYQVNPRIYDFFIFICRKENYAEAIVKGRNIKFTSIVRDDRYIIQDFNTIAKNCYADAYSIIVSITNGGKDVEAKFDYNDEKEPLKAKIEKFEQSIKNN